MAVRRNRTGKGWTARYPVAPSRYQEQTFDLRSDAEDHYREKVDLYRKGEYVQDLKGKNLVWEVCDEWFKLQLKTPNYMQNVRSHIKNHIVPALGTRRVSSVKQEDLQRLANRLAEALVPTSTRTVMSTAKMIFRWAHKKRLVVLDPTVGLKLPQAEKREIVPLLPDMVWRIADEMFPRYRAVVLCSAGSGARQGETFGIKVKDLDFAPGEGSIRIRQQIQSYTGVPQTEQPTKSKKHRTVPTDDETMQLLHDHIDQYGASSDGYIFTNQLGKPLHRRVFDRSFSAATRRAADKYMSEAREKYGDDAVEIAKAQAYAEQIRETVFHEFRHFYAAMLFAAGHSVKTVAARLGHSDPALTLRTYAHVMPDDADKTRDAIGKFHGSRRSL